jgi:hypothetical protein
MFPLDRGGGLTAPCALPTLTRDLAAPSRLLPSLKEEAGQRSPEVLSALAVKAKDVAEYLEKMADQARSRRDAGEPGTEATDASPRDEMP